MHTAHNFSSYSCLGVFFQHVPDNPVIDVQNPTWSTFMSSVTLTIEYIPYFNDVFAYIWSTDSHSTLTGDREIWRHIVNWHYQTTECYPCCVAEITNVWLYIREDNLLEVTICIRWYVWTKLGYSLKRCFSRSKGNLSFIQPPVKRWYSTDWI